MGRTPHRGGDLGPKRRTMPGMAAKRKIAPPKPRLDLPWSELSKAQRNQIYTKALHAYGRGEGPNPGTSGQFARRQTAPETNA